MLPLLGCPAEDPPAEPDTSSTSDTDVPPPDTDTDSNPPDTDTTTPPDTDTDAIPDTDTDSNPPDTDTDTGPDPIAGCECIPDDTSEGSPDAPSDPTCGEPLCPTVSLTCKGYCSDGPVVLEDPAALECALLALRDRTPGLVEWSSHENGGQYSDHGYVLVNADGVAVRRNWGWSDLYYQTSAAILGALPPPEDFDACLAEPDDLARFQCLRGQLSTQIAVCDEGWDARDPGV